jgi:hypothetical protein
MYVCVLLLIKVIEKVPSPPYFHTILFAYLSEITEPRFLLSTFSSVLVCTLTYTSLFNIFDYALLNPLERVL